MAFNLDEYLAQAAANRSLLGQGITNNVMKTRSTGLLGLIDSFQGALAGGVGNLFDATAASATESGNGWLANEATYLGNQLNDVARANRYEGDESGILDILNITADAAGSSVPSIATGLASRSIGTAAGAAAGSIVPGYGTLIGGGIGFLTGAAGNTVVDNFMNAGQTYRDSLERGMSSDQAVENYNKSIDKGWGASLEGAIGDQLMLGIGKGVGAGLTKAAAAFASDGGKVASKTLAKSLAGTAIDIGASAALEGHQEAWQTMIANDILEPGSMDGVSVVNPFTWTDDMNNAFKQAAIASIVLGGAAHGIRAGYNKLTSSDANTASNSEAIGPDTWASDSNPVGASVEPSESVTGTSGIVTPTEGIDAENNAPETFDVSGVNPVGQAEETPAYDGVFRGLNSYYEKQSKKDPIDEETIQGKMAGAQATHDDIISSFWDNQNDDEARMKSADSLRNNAYVEDYKSRGYSEAEAKVASQDTVKAIKQKYGTPEFPDTKQSRSLLERADAAGVELDDKLRRGLEAENPLPSIIKRVTPMVEAKEAEIAKQQAKEQSETQAREKRDAELQKYRNERWNDSVNKELFTDVVKRENPNLSPEETDRVASQLALATNKAMKVRDSEVNKKKNGTNKKNYNNYNNYLRQQGVDLSKVSNESRETILNHMKYVGALRSAKVNKADVITATRDLRKAERTQKYYTDWANSVDEMAPDAESEKKFRANVARIAIEGHAGTQRNYNGVSPYAFTRRPVHTSKQQKESFAKAVSAGNSKANEARKIVSNQFITNDIKGTPHVVGSAYNTVERNAKYKDALLKAINPKASAAEIKKRREKETRKAEREAKKSNGGNYNQQDYMTEEADQPDDMAEEAEGKEDTSIQGERKKRDLIGKILGDDENKQDATEEHDDFDGYDQSDDIEDNKSEGKQEEKTQPKEAPSKPKKQITTKEETKPEKQKKPTSELTYKELAEKYRNNLKGLLREFLDKNITYNLLRGASFELEESYKSEEARNAASKIRNIALANLGDNGKAKDITKTDYTEEVNTINEKIKKLETMANDNNIAYHTFKLKADILEIDIERFFKKNPYAFGEVKFKMPKRNVMTRPEFVKYIRSEDGVNNIPYKVSNSVIEKPQSFKKAFSDFYQEMTGTKQDKTDQRASNATLLSVVMHEFDVLLTDRKPEEYSEMFSWNEYTAESAIKLARAISALFPNGKYFSKERTRIEYRREHYGLGKNQIFRVPPEYKEKVEKMKDFAEGILTGVYAPKDSFGTLIDTANAAKARHKNGDWDHNNGKPTTKTPESIRDITVTPMSNIVNVELQYDPKSEKTKEWTPDYIKENFENLFGNDLTRVFLGSSEDTAEDFYITDIDTTNGIIKIETNPMFTGTLYDTKDSNKKARQKALKAAVEGSYDGTIVFTPKPGASMTTLKNDLKEIFGDQYELTVTDERTVETEYNGIKRKQTQRDFAIHPKGKEITDDDLAGANLYKVIPKEEREKASANSMAKELGRKTFIEQTPKEAKESATKFLNIRDPRFEFEENMGLAAGIYVPGQNKIKLNPSMVMSNDDGTYLHEMVHNAIDVAIDAGNTDDLVKIAASMVKTVGGKIYGQFANEGKNYQTDSRRGVLDGKRSDRNVPVDSGTPGFTGESEERNGRPLPGETGVPVPSRGRNGDEEGRNRQGGNTGVPGDHNPSGGRELPKDGGSDYSWFAEVWETIRKIEKSVDLSNESYRKNLAANLAYTLGELQKQPIKYETKISGMALILSYTQHLDERLGLKGKDSIFYNTITNTRWWNIPLVLHETLAYGSHTVLTGHQIRAIFDIGTKSAKAVQQSGTQKQNEKTKPDTSSINTDKRSEDKLDQITPLTEAAAQKAKAWADNMKNKNNHEKITEIKRQNKSGNIPMYGLKKYFQSTLRLIDKYINSDVANKLRHLAKQHSIERNSRIKKYFGKYEEIINSIPKERKEKLQNMLRVIRDQGREFVQTYNIEYKDANGVAKSGFVNLGPNGFLHEFGDEQDAKKLYEKLKSEGKFTYYDFRDGNWRVFSSDTAMKGYNSYEQARKVARTEGTKAMLDKGYDQDVIEDYWKIRDLLEGIQRLREDSAKKSGIQRDDPNYPKYRYGYIPSIHSRFGVWGVTEIKDGDKSYFKPEKLASFNTLQDARRFANKQAKKIEGVDGASILIVERADMFNDATTSLEEQGSTLDMNANTILEEYISDNDASERFKQLGKAYPQSTRLVNAMFRGNKNYSRTQFMQLIENKKVLKQMGVDYKALHEELKEANIDELFKKKDVVAKKDVEKFMYLGYGSHLRDRANYKYTGAKGANPDVLRSIGSYVQNQVHYTTNNEFYYKATQLYKDITGKDYGDQFRGMNARGAENDIEDILHNLISGVIGSDDGFDRKVNQLFNESPVGKFVRAHYGEEFATDFMKRNMEAVTIAKLGLLRPTAVIAQLGALLNLYTRAGANSHFFRAIRDSAPSFVKKGVKVTDDERRMFDEIGLNLDNTAMETQTLGREKSLYNLTIKGKRIGKLLETSMKLFNEADKLTRRATALFAYRKALSEGKSREEAVTAAEKMVDEVCFEYSDYDAPMMFRKWGTLGKMILQFKKYPVKEFEFMMNTFQKGDKRELARFLSSYVLSAGILGLPAAGAGDALWKWLFGKEYSTQMKDAAFQWAGKDSTKRQLVLAAFYGLPANVLGVDFSRNIGLGDIIPTDDLAGPTLTTYGKLIQGLHGADSANNAIINAAHDLSPAIGNYYQAATGRRRDWKNNVDAEHYSIGERVAKAFGFRNIREAVDSDMSYISYQKDTEEKNKRKTLINQYIDDPKSVDKAELERYGIESSDIQKAKANMVLTKTEKAKENSAKNPKTEISKEKKLANERYNEFIEGL